MKAIVSEITIPGNVQKCVDVVLEMWLSGGLGSVGLMVGLNDLRGLSQPQGFCASKATLERFYKCKQGQHFHIWATLAELEEIF